MNFSLTENTAESLGFDPVAYETAPAAASAKWPWESDPSNPDAYPVMATLNTWGGWSPAEWMQWHAAMRTAYGLATANTRFLTAWADDGVLSGPPLDARSFNTAFRDYAKTNGFFDGLYNGLGVIAKPIGAANDVVDAASKSASTAAKIAEWVLPAAILIGAAVIAAPYAAPHVRRALKAIKA